MKPSVLIVFLLTACLADPGFAGNLASAAGDSHKSTHRGLIVIEGDFHGWNAIVVRSKVATVVIVPAIGRVMRFSLNSSHDESDDEVSPGPFWSNPSLDKEMKADSEGWINFGGDKAWPAPQADWPKIAGKGWPPPKTFDDVPYTSSVMEGRVQLTSPVDPAYGVRVVRNISLDPRQPVLTIKTTYEKVRGDPIRIGVWTITQLRSPVRAFMLLPQNSTIPQGYASFLPVPPKDLQVDGRLVSIIRDKENKTMIGTDAEAILWVGDGPDLLIKNSSPEKSGEWPEKGSHAKIYTNSGEEMKYVEFELLGPLHDLNPGESSNLTSTYTLIPRTEREPLSEAKKILGVN